VLVIYRRSAKPDAAAYAINRREPSARSSDAILISQLSGIGQFPLLHNHNADTRMRAGQNQHA